MGKKRNRRLMILGFCCFVLGSLSLFLELAGVNYVFMAWIDGMIGKLGGLLLKIALIVGGLMMVTIAVSPDEEEGEEKDTFSKKRT